MPWYTLTTLFDASGTLVARFKPDRFTVDAESPVMVLRIDNPMDHAAARTLLERFRDDWLVDHEVKEGLVMLLSHADWEQSTIRGKQIEVAFDTYSVTELRDIASELATQLERSHEEMAAKGRKLAEIEHFVSEQLARADKKISLSHRDATALELRRDILVRVLNRIQD